MPNNSSKRVCLSMLFPTSTSGTDEKVDGVFLKVSCSSEILLHGTCQLRQESCQIYHTELKIMLKQEAQTDALKYLWSLS